jgi:ankyrin repeat protein
MSHYKAAQLFGYSLLKGLCDDPQFIRAKLDFESIRQGIKFGGVAATGSNGDTLLHAFSNNGNHDAVIFLLNLGANVEMPSKLSQTPLDLAVMTGHEQAIELLLKKGAIVYLEDHPTTALYKASTMGYTGSVRLLLEHRKPVSWDAPTLLYQTAVNNHATTLQVLLEYGAKDRRSVADDYSPFFKTQASRPRRRTALHEAIARGLPDSVIEMLINDDNVLAVDSKGRTVLHEGAICGSISVMELLMKSKAEISATDPEGNTPLHHAITRDTEESGGIVKLLLENRANVNAIDNNGNTPLHLAIFTDGLVSVEIIGLLFQYNADVNGTERLTREALAKMVARGTPGAAAIVNLLLNKNAEVAGLLDLKYNEEEYVRFMGPETARRILTRLSAARRHNTQNSGARGRRGGSLWKRGRTVGRNTTMCISSRKTGLTVEFWG